MKIKIFIILMVFCCCASARAQDWQIDEAHSRLSFSGHQNDQEFSGGFKKFTAHISLDPAHPEKAKINVAIDTASAYAGSKDRDDLLPQKEWFDVAAFPQAFFTSTALRKIDETHYEADAVLSIKGMTRNVTMLFTLAPEGDHWRAQGHIILKRQDFGVGSGIFNNETYVKNAVEVTVDLQAKPASR